MQKKTGHIPGEENSDDDFSLNIFYFIKYT